MKEQGFPHSVSARPFSFMLLAGAFGWSLLLLEYTTLYIVWFFDGLIILMSVYFNVKKRVAVTNRKAIAVGLIFFLTGLAGFAKLYLGVFGV